MNKLRVALALLLAASPAAVLGAPPRKGTPPSPAASASASASASAAASAASSASASAVAEPAPSSSTPAPAASAEVPEEEAPVEEDPEARGEAAVLWPTTVPLGDGVSPGPLRVPDEKERGVAERARALDRVLTEAAQDLGLMLDVGARSPSFPRSFRDSELIEEAKGRNAWIISPRIERDGGEWLLKIVAVSPGSKVVMVREERVSAARLPVRGVVMLRDLLRFRSNTPSPPALSREEPGESPTRSKMSGRGVLVATLATFGGYAGYALHTSSRGNDPRLLYPLMALGTGIGLGAATIVADEWELSLGEAWFLTAGTVWPSTSALLLSAGYNVSPSTDAHAFALVAGIGGLGLSTAALARRNVGEGAALMAHSGGVLGGGLGALVEMTARGSTQETPYRGAGFGMAGGWAVGGLLGSLLDPLAGRVLRIDLGAGLGALGGAALGSPLLLENPSKNQERLWLGAVMGGAVVGAGVGAWLSRPSRVPTKTARLLPVPGVVAASRGAGGEVRPIMGLTWSGRW